MAIAVMRKNNHQDDNFDNNPCFFFAKYRGDVHCCIAETATDTKSYMPLSIDERTVLPVVYRWFMMSYALIRPKSFIAHKHADAVKPAAKTAIYIVDESTKRNAMPYAAERNKAWKSSVMQDDVGKEMSQHEYDVIEKRQEIISRHTREERKAVNDD
ncbi:hypothetical protein DPMN_031212 [Dreissena polymorpha]|uniref:Uncharacterized protein n=1 Tax=Dreissena polymorpha TaxID=45954 RepID=A0A9D4M1G6_DREPO|nr:hypothetical protein DPMN_031212 [Dreissena polymorpha]